MRFYFPIWRVYSTEPRIDFSNWINNFVLWMKPIVYADRHLHTAVCFYFFLFLPTFNRHRLLSYTRQNHKLIAPCIYEMPTRDSFFSLETIKWVVMIFLAELRWFHEFGATKKYYFLLKRAISKNVKTKRKATLKW